MQHSRFDPHEIFENALKLDAPEQRQGYLEQVCEHDPELLEQVEALLREHEQDGSLTGHASPPVKTQIMEASPEAPGTVIGPYKLRERLGEGGMGIVYLAEQREPIRRKLALKIIKPGMDSRNVIARFEAERQALAMMSHPNIARILDGGTTDQGRPYFVMELVRGIPINDYCDRHQLTIRERLKLFVSVCHAVQHAHLKGIIHRDLKPSNILVEQHGENAVPKVIDFGIAKALDQQLTEQTVYTQFAQLIGTPEYMSPEQARLSEVDIDTRSDIYSLGVMLYELLTGTLPYKTRRDSRIGFDDIRRIISEDEPRRPSQKLSTLDNQAISTVSYHRRSDPKQLSISMRRELDWVALKALEKDRSRRYQSATALADDIERYLNHEPVQACPPSFTYRLRKLLYQNRTFVIASTIVVMSALAGTAVSIRYASEASSAAATATEAQSRAEANARKFERATEYLRRLGYATDIKLVSEFWKDGDWRSLAETLDHYSPPEAGQEDLRGFEWWFLHNLSTGDSHLLDSRDEQGCLARYSPDGRSLVLGWTDGRIDVRDAQTHDFLFSLEGNGDFVNGCDFHPQQNLLATIADDSRLRVWNLDTQKLMLNIKACTGHGHRVFFSADGETLVTSGEEDRVRFWETSTGKPLGEIDGFSKHDHSGVEERMSCSPSREWLAIGDGEGAGAIYDFRARKKLVDLAGLNEHDSLRCLRFSPDGRYVAGGKKSRTVYVWRADNGQQIARFKGHLDDIQDLVFYPDGRHLLSCDRAGVIHLWNLDESAKPSHSKSHHLLHASAAFRGHNDRIWSLDLSTEGSELVTGSRDDSFRIWTADDERSHRHVPAEDPTRVAFLNGGDALLIADKNQLRIWNQASGDIRTLATHSEPFVHLDVNEAKRVVATVDEAKWIQVWDLASGELISNFTSDVEGHCILSIFAEGRSLVCADYLSSTVTLWKLDASRQPRLLQTIGGEEKEDYERFDGAWLTPDGNSLVLHQLNELHLYDLRTRTVGRKFQIHTNRVYTVAFSNDGKLMASGSNDRTVCIWDFATGELLHCIAAHKNEVQTVAFSPDGRTLVSGDEDGHIVFTHIDTGRVLFETQIEDGGIDDLEFSPDGEHLAVVQPNSLILLSGKRDSSDDEL